MDIAIPVIVVVAIVLCIVIYWMIAGQKQEAAWKQLASELGGEFIKGGFLKANAVRAQIKGRTATLDTYSVPSGDSSTAYTRLRVPYQNKDGLQFALSKRGLVSKLDKALGAKEIETGDPAFDRDYVIRGNTDPKVQALFSHQNIRQLIQTQPALTLMIKGNELHLEMTGVINDVERLKACFELFKVMLDQLEG
jgi:hypothetical protein